MEALLERAVGLIRQAGASYGDLRIRHEGFDIQLLADAVAGGKTAAGTAAIEQPPSLLGDDQPPLPPKIDPDGVA